MSDFPRKYSQLKRKLRFELENRFGEEAYMLERLLWEDWEIKKDQELSDAIFQTLMSRVSRLFAGEPIQYILEKGHFYDRDFRVSPSVLIPRRETEELLVWVRNEVEKRNHHQPFRILDIGTGSGCIPISLDLELRELGIPAEIWGMDISPDALVLAINNAQDLSSAVQFFEADILTTSAKALGKWDVIISNPPYVLEQEKEQMAIRVKEHEPGLALFVPDETPLLFYEKISALAKACLKPEGLLFFEIHEDFGPQVVKMLEELKFSHISMRKDMQAKDRMISARI